MTTTDCRRLADDLVSALALTHPPLAISFTNDAPIGVPSFDAPLPAPTADGRTGRVPAGCVFWMKAADRTFTTVAEDHANCSVGSVTHGFKTLTDVAQKADVGALVQSGWVSPEMFPQIPVVAERYRFVVYGPLRDAALPPDVVLLRVNAKQAMTVSDAFPDAKFEGKPQCHIIPMAKQGAVAVSVGCMLSRVRTGMPNTEMTCAIPGRRLADVVQKLQAVREIDNTVAQYAAADAQRF